MRFRTLSYHTSESLLHHDLSIGEAVGNLGGVAWESPGITSQFSQTPKPDMAHVVAVVEA